MRIVLKLKKKNNQFVKNFNKKRMKIKISEALKTTKKNNKQLDALFKMVYILAV